VTERNGAAVVAAAAEQVVEMGLARDRSVFSPDVPVWTLANARELHGFYVDRPDTSATAFKDKLRRQLADASDGAKQLYAELLFLNMLPLTDYHGATKRALIETVLSWCSRAVEIPGELLPVFDEGVFRGGMSFKTGRWEQLSFLVQFVSHWKSLTRERRDAALRDPWAFQALVESAPGPRVPTQRGALVYLAFPGTFLPMVSVDHKKRIRQAFRDHLPEPTGNLDRDILTIKQALERDHGQEVQFYAHPWVDHWHPTKGAGADSVPTGEEVAGRRAWLVRGSSVNGYNLVPTWLEEGFVSLAASTLRPVEAGLDRAEVKAIVDQDYQHKSYAARTEKTGEFHAFLSRMQVGDVVVTTSGGNVYLGVVTGDTEWGDSPEKRSNLRRSVEWRNVDDPVEFAELPAPLPAKLSSQSDVVDLTEELAQLERLLGEEPALAEPEPSGTLVLEPADDALAERLLVDKAWLQEVIDLLDERRQVILYGPPGTGKTYLAQHIAWHLTERNAVKLVQFHPSYSYEDFFEGYRPVSGEDGKVGFELKPGPFRRIVEAARADPSTPHVLIIDEINRGNLAKVFGELYFLLEYRDKSIGLLYSAGEEDSFTLPGNVFLIGTMNTADRSIALIDTAMRRRFAFVALHPAQEPVRGLLGRWLTEQGYSDEPARLLGELNRRLADLDYAIGLSYLMRDSVIHDAGLERIWRTSIMPLLEELHYGEHRDLDHRYGLAALRKRITGTSDVEE